MQGSPNSDGSTALLASEFARGAHETGHGVEVVGVAVLDVAPCTGCVACGYGGPCALGYGCGTPSMTKRSEYPRQAYLLGRGLAE